MLKLRRSKDDGEKWDKGLYDVFARAMYMNKALKSGLADASRKSAIGGMFGTKLFYSSLIEFIGLNIYADIAIIFSDGELTGLPAGLGLLTGS